MGMKIAKGWNEVTILQYQQMTDIENAGLTPFEKNLQLIGILANVPQNKVEDMKINEIKSLTAQLGWVSDKPKRQIHKFKIGKTVYVVDRNISAMTAGQFIDISEYAKEGVNENLHKIMTVFCKPTKGNFLWRKTLNYGEGYDTKELSEVFRTQLTMEIVYPLSLFFCDMWNRLEPVMQEYLRRKQSKMNKLALDKMREALRTIGDGSSY